MRIISDWTNIITIGFPWRIIKLKNVLYFLGATSNKTTSCCSRNTVSQLVQQHDGGHEAYYGHKQNSCEAQRHNKTAYRF